MNRSADLRVNSYMEFVHFIPEPLRPLYCVLLALSQSARQVHAYHELVPPDWQLLSADLIRLKQVWRHLNGGALGRVFKGPQMLEASRARLLLLWSMSGGVHVYSYYLNGLVKVFGKSGEKPVRKGPPPYRTRCVDPSTSQLDELVLDMNNRSFLFTIELDAYVVSNGEGQGDRQVSWEVELHGWVPLKKLDASVVRDLTKSLPVDLVSFSEHPEFVGDRGEPICSFYIRIPWTEAHSHLPPVATPSWSGMSQFLPPLQKSLNAAGIPVTGIERAVLRRQRMFPDS